MPKINRVRIVNFSYNNNNRHIIDECFDFYGGENALLSLANGGGKSVLVQAMLQPILPKVSLLGRKFRDFFIAKRTPAYIMIEWKIDDEAGYLLSGIAIASIASHSTDEEEENTDIRYFTFLSAYEEANAFDIKNIPVTEQIGSNIRIASYNKFKELLQKESRRNQSELFVYDSTREEQSQYDKKLNSYSISKEEWKELIVNINEAEHGVSEVFSECKTSRKVMEQWVIKYIEKVLDKSYDSDVTDHKKLETMMAQVAQSLVDNENYIREYKAIEGFNQELDNIYNDAKVVLSNLDNEDRLKKDISEGYQVLKNEEQRLEQELIDIVNRLKELNDEFELIALEEKSQEIYKYTEEVEIVDERLMDLDEAVKKQKSILEDKKYKLDLQKAAEKFGKVLEKQKAIAELQQRLDNASKDQENLLKNLNQIKYSLKIAYNNQVIGIKKEIEDANIKVNGIMDDIEKNKIEYTECQTQIERFNKEIGSVETEISNFENEEPGILESLNIQIYRNPFIKELDQQDTIKVKALLLKEYQELEVLLDESRINAEKLKETLNELGQRKEELTKKYTELKVAESEIASRIGIYKDEKQKVLEALKRLDINSDYLFDSDYLAKAAKEYLNDWENKAHHLKMEINELDKQIHGIEKGVSYLPASFVALLEEHNLPCYTGEKYLREIYEEDKKRLITSNPLLPYALIATEKEIALIEQLASDTELSQIIPIIRYNQREQEIELGHENMQFIVSSKNISLDNGNIGILVKSLMDKKDDKMLELEKAIEVIARVNHDYQIIVNFNWSEKQVNELENERRINEKEINKNDETIQACIGQVKDTGSRRNWRSE